MNRSELTFTSATELNEFFSGLGYVRLPGRPFYSHACDSFDDLGRPIITFARRCYAEVGQPFVVQFVELVKRGRV